MLLFFKANLLDFRSSSPIYVEFDAALPPFHPIPPHPPHLLYGFDQRWFESPQALLYWLSIL